MDDENKSKTQLIAEIAELHAQLAAETARHRQIVDALNVSLEKYRVLFDSFPLGITITDDTGQIVETNAVAERLLAVPRSVHAERTIDDAAWRIVRLDGTPMPPEEYASVRALKEQRVVENVEMGIVKGADLTTWISVSAAPIPLPGYGVAITYHDVGDRIRMESALREAEQRFRSMFERHDAIMLLLDPVDGAIVDANAAAAQYYGYPLAQLQRMNIMDVNQSAPERVVRDIEQAMAGVRNHFVFPHRLANGEVRTVEVHTTPISVGAQTMLFSIIHDVSGRVAAEESLHFTQFVLDHMADAVFWADADGRVTYVNESACRRLGYSAAELLTLHVWDLAPGSSPERWVLHWSELQRAGSVKFESNHRTRTGQIIPVEIQTNYVAFGQRAYACGIARDITERKRAEEALKASEDNYRSLVETSDNAIVTLNREGEIFYANPVSIRIMDDPSLVGRTLHDLFPPETAGRFLTVVRRVIDEKIVDLNELQLTIRGVAMWFRVSMTPIKHSDGTVNILLLNAVDVTMKKRAEDALRLSEDRFRTIFFSAAIGMSLVDADRRFRLVNPALERFLGMPAAQLLQLDAQAVTHPDDWEIDAALFAETCAGQRNGYTVDKRYLCADGRLRWGRLTISTMRDANGNVSGAINMVEDVTERRHAATELARARDAAEAANRAKSEFLANMSHELRTPLNAILGFSEMMTRDGNLTLAQQENLAIINRSGEHLLRLINGVLDMAKIESGRITLQEHDFDLHAMLADLVELFRARAEAKGLTLMLSVWPATPPFIHADEGKLRQVLTNLLGNALKFTESGSIELSVQRCCDTDQPCHLCFAVQDSGLGIAPDDIAVIFDPFVQSGSALSAPEGTGLGLAISQHLVKLMGGRLTAASAGVPGQGSCFQFTLPIAAATPVAGRTHTSAMSVRATRLATGQPEYRILVVEDHYESRKLLTELLERLGFAVRTANDGVQAIEVWESWRPHLIWMDMRMPVMDGHTATRRIKGAAQGQAPIIIALTASVFEAELAQVLADGCDDFVRKPFRETEIVACLVKHLGVRMVYADGAPSVTPAAASPGFNLTGLPPAWVAQVRSAAAAADAARLLALAAAVEAPQPALADALRRWVGDYDYAAIEAALGNAEGERTR